RSCAALHAVRGRQMVRCRAPTARGLRRAPRWAKAPRVPHNELAAVCAGLFLFAVPRSAGREHSGATRMKWSGVILGLACLCALIGVGGCDDSDSGRRLATPTASAPATPIAPSPTHTPIRVGETPPPAHTDTPSEDRSPTARPSPLDSATP